MIEPAVRSGSRCLAKIVSQQTAKAFAALDVALQLTDFLSGMYQLVVQALMVSLAMIVPQVISHGATKHVLAEKGHPGKAFRFDAEVESLDM